MVKCSRQRWQKTGGWRGGGGNHSLFASVIQLFTMHSIQDGAIRWTGGEREEEREGGRNTRDGLTFHILPYPGSHPPTRKEKKENIHTRKATENPSPPINETIALHPTKHPPSLMTRRHPSAARRRPGRCRLPRRREQQRGRRLRPPRVWPTAIAPTTRHYPICGRHRRRRGCCPPGFQVPRFRGEPSYAAAQAHGARSGTGEGGRWKRTGVGSAAMRGVR